MALSAADWLIAAVPLTAVLLIAWRVRHQTRSVSDFLAGGRRAGRYLVTVADGMAVFGLASVVAGFEFTYTSGFAAGFWGSLAAPVSAILALTGFVIYRYRETRCLTLAQFYELRYSRGVRVAAGSLAWMSGVVAYAIFPAVAGRFVVAYCGLPSVVKIGAIALPTYAVLSGVFLLFALAVVLHGGQVPAMVTDCVQGIFAYIGYAVVIAAVLSIFSFSQFRDVMLARPPGKSFVDPFDTAELTDFNILFVLIGIIGGIYNRMSWHGAQAYQASGASPHEQKMAGLLSTWRAGLTFLMVMLLGFAAYTYMHHADFAADAASVRLELESLAAGGSVQGTEALRSQLVTPLAVRHFLPDGVAGVFLAVMLFLMVTTDTTNLHAWGSLLVQDVVLPFRKAALDPQWHLFFLRLAIVAVAFFAWVFSLLFEQTTYLYMFLALAGSLYLGCAGALLIGGLYWKRGTTVAAWCTLGAGTLWALVSFSLTSHWESIHYPWLAANAPRVLAILEGLVTSASAALPVAAWHVTATRFPFSGAELAFANILLCSSLYILVSLATCRQPFNLDRMLHRGSYALREEEGGRPPVAVEHSIPLWKKLTGIDDQYTRGDKILAASVLVWGVQSSVVFYVVIASNVFFGRWGAGGFFLYWQYYQIILSLCIGAITTVWFTWGASRDLGAFLRALPSAPRDALDDGRVIAHTNADDVRLLGPNPGTTTAPPNSRT